MHCCFGWLSVSCAVASAAEHLQLPCPCTALSDGLASVALWQIPFSTCSYPVAALQDSHEAYTGPFEDEQTRVVYETLPDLRATIPSALLGDTAQGDQPSSSQGHSSDQPDAGDGADLPGEPDRTIFLGAC